MGDRELKEDERRFVLDYIGSKSVNDEVVWMNWVRKRKRNKIQPRLLVISKYRVMSVKRGGMGGSKKVQREGAILDLKEIASPETGYLKLSWADFSIECATDPTLADQALTTLRLHLARMTLGFPEASLPRIDVTPTRLQPLPEIDFGPAEGFGPTYEAMCNYFSQRPSSELMTLVSDTFDSGSTELDLTECPGIELKTAYTFDLLPVLSALRFNSYFTSFKLRNVVRKDVVGKLAGCIAGNSVIDRIIVTSCDASEGFAEFGQALVHNKTNRLVELNFSGNKIGDKGIAGLATGLAALDHPLVKLNLRNTALTPKGVATAFEAMASNWAMSAGMVELDMSDNKFGQEGAQALAMWLQNLGLKQPALKRLVLANVELDIFSVIQAAKSGILKTLTELDISGNTIDRAAAQALGLAIKEPDNALSRIRLANTKITGEALEFVMSCITQNANIRDMKLDLSNNNLGADGANAIAKTVVICNNIHTLGLRDNKFRPESFQKIVDAFQLNSSLKSLDLSLNMQPKKGVRELSSALGILVQKHVALTSLNLAGDGKINIAGPDFEPFLQALSGASNLRELTISGNGFGDKAATTLADALRKNNSLQVLRWDDNNVTLGGWQSFKAMLAAGNTTLCDVKYPRTDIDRMLGKNKDARMRDKINDTMSFISDALKANRAANPDFKLRDAKEEEEEGESGGNVFSTYRQSTLMRAPPQLSRSSAPSDDYGAYKPSGGHQSAPYGGGGGRSGGDGSGNYALPPPNPPDDDDEPPPPPPPAYEDTQQLDSYRAPPPQAAPTAYPSTTPTAYPSAYPSAPTAMVSPYASSTARVAAAPSPYAASTARGMPATGAPGFGAPPPLKVAGGFGAPPPIMAPMGLKPPGFSVPKMSVPPALSSSAGSGGYSSPGRPAEPPPPPPPGDDYVEDVDAYAEDGDVPPPPYDPDEDGYDDEPPPPPPDY